MSDIIDINVGETIEEVTINVTDNLITVNINKVTGGGGGTQTLAQTLVLGNITDGENISISNGDAIILDNGSMLKKGTIDAGNGGSKGIAQICGVGFEHKWEAGRLYIMNDGGTIIREVSHNLTYTPTVTDDVTKGFVQNTRWILDNGDVYVCTDPTEGAAVWEFITGVVPTLQQVMETGRSYNQTIGDYTYRLEFDEADGAYISVTDTNLNTVSALQLQQEASIFYSDDSKIVSAYASDFGAGLQATESAFGQNVLNVPFKTSGSGITYFQPPNNKAAGSYTLAITDDIPSLTGYVPYTGATADVDLGEYELKAGQIELDTTPTGTAGVAVTRWNDSLGISETTLKGGNVILKNGIDLVARVVNKVSPNTTLTKAAYQVVRISGAQGQRLAVDLAQANNDNNSADTLGIVTETIAANQEGFIITVGQLEGINTTGSLQGETWADGDVLYLSPTTAGRITNIKPNGLTGHIVVLGYVEHAHITQGKIYVKIMNGWELDELHNVFIDTPLNNQGLVYETSTDLWKNKTIIADSITNGITDIAPSQNSVFDALSLKQNALSYTPFRFVQTSQTAHTGTVAETVIATATINGNTFNSSDVIKLLFKATKTNTATLTMRIKINTTNTLVGATQIALFNTAIANTYALMTRTFDLNGGNLFGYNFTSSIISDIINTNTVGTSTSYNTSNTLYVFFTFQLNNTTDTAIPNLINITN